MPEILRVGPDDWADWRAVRLAALASDPAAFAASAHAWAGENDREQAWRDRLAIPGSASFLAGSVGMVGWLPADDGVELVSMWVAPSARGAGLGEALVRRVLADAPAPVALRVMADNPAALRLYERCGFTPTGPLDAEGCLPLRRG